MNLTFIGTRIKQLRTNVNITMAELGKSVGTSSGYISDLEKSKRIPSFELVLKICEAFNITLSDFFNEGTEPVTLTPEVKELLDSVKNLSPEQLELLSKFFKSIK